MKSNQKIIYLVSHKNPTGVSWLVNCLIALKYRVEWFGRKKTWEKHASGWSLTKECFDLRNMLPELQKRDVLQFNQRLIIKCSHDLFEPDADTKIFTFVRNPADAVYHRYLRNRKNSSNKLSFEEFLRIPDFVTLLSPDEDYLTYYLYWLNKHDNFLGFSKFEDYKLDPKQTLISSLQKLNLIHSEDEIQYALESSEYKNYKGSSTSRTKGASTLKFTDTLDEIELSHYKQISHKAAQLNQLLGYNSNVEQDDYWNGLDKRFVKSCDWYSKINLPDSMVSDTDDYIQDQKIRDFLKEGLIVRVFEDEFWTVGKKMHLIIKLFRYLIQSGIPLPNYPYFLIDMAKTFKGAEFRLRIKLLLMIYIYAFRHLELRPALKLSGILTAKIL